MKVIEERFITFSNGKSVTNFTLWNDTTPASLDITGADIGRPDDEIACGSFLLTPYKRYAMNESGSFVEIKWGEDEPATEEQP